MLKIRSGFLADIEELSIEATTGGTVNYSLVEVDSVFEELFASSHVISSVDLDILSRAIFKSHCLDLSKSSCVTIDFVVLENE